MPILTGVTTKTAQQKWASPDGERKIHHVIFMLSDGQIFEAETYSSDIPIPGWTGDIITEERPGKFGPQTFVKQAPKDDGFASGSASVPGSNMRVAQANKGSFDKDPKSFYYAYAKDLVVALVNTDGFTLQKLEKLVEGVKVAGEELYDASTQPKQLLASVDDLLAAAVDNLDKEDAI